MTLTAFPRGGRTANTFAFPPPVMRADKRCLIRISYEPGNKNAQLNFELLSLSRELKIDTTILNTGAWRLLWYLHTPSNYTTHIRKDDDNNEALL